MTDNEIIKALEICSSDAFNDSKERCTGCKYDGADKNLFCFEVLEKDALDLINRQKAEIKEKDEMLSAQADKIRLLEYVLKEKVEEIERLEAEADTYTTLCKEIHDKVVMNFAERLKKRLWDSTGIDEIVKEMTEGNI